MFVFDILLDAPVLPVWLSLGRRLTAVKLQSLRTRRVSRIPHCLDPSPNALGARPLALKSIASEQPPDWVQRKLAQCDLELDEPGAVW